MDWKRLLHSKWAQRGLCFAIALSILVSLCIPSTKLHTAVPQNPLQHSEVHEVEELLLGEIAHKQTESSEVGEDADATQQEQPEESEQQDEPEEPEEPEQPEEIEQPTESAQPDEPQPQEPEQSEEPGQSEEPMQSDEPTQSDEPSEGTEQPQEPTQGESEESGSGDGEEGNEDGKEGGEDGEETALELSMVMTWYKYGTQPKTIVCGYDDVVSKAINTAQLPNQELHFVFTMVGEDASHVTISSVFVKAGDGAYREISDSGSIIVAVPEGGMREYTFCVDALLQKRDAQGNPIEQAVQFTYVLRCSNSLDLDLELTWVQQSTVGKVTCAPNQTVSKTVENYALIENVFAYTPKLLGTLAEQATIVGASYTTASGGSGTLQADGGSLVFRTPEGQRQETYYLTFTVNLVDEDGGEQLVFYHITIVFVQTLDIKLSFTWLERGMTRKKLTCQPDSTVSQTIKNNQLSAGTVKYEIALEGADTANARILNVSYTSEASGGGKLDVNGALPLTLPEGYVANTYTILVVVLANGQQINFAVVLKYTMDVRLEMQYSVVESGTQSRKSVLCETGKSKTAEAIYDDQLTDGVLLYQMSIVGAEDVTITAVTCYQSGSGRTVLLAQTGEISLLLKDGKTGENNFVITAEDTDGTRYEFKINIPYKHRGENSVKISTNMTDGQTVTNEADNNLHVSAWTEDASGQVVSYIPANGVDTKLIVTLDGEVIRYVSSSGPASEYILRPANPEVGDSNEHTLRIYAEDALGNYGELTLTLQGQRNQAGQKKGTATIYVDMTVLGLGIVGTVHYDVLADEPISYAVAKAVLGMDTGEPFGAATESLGWKGSYSGTLDTGFYLQSLTPGVTAYTLEGSPWSYYGSTEEEILQSIDNYFGKGTGLATLWRCIYRNGLNKSGGSGGAYGEHDYTNGSGWMFSLDGTYYPGLSMSDYSLEDGDVLTLRYTLAYGWDVGGGTTGYGNSLGYCVTALHGGFSINHEMETIAYEDGSHRYVCRCCGLVEACAHEHTVGRDTGDGYHILFCGDCQTAIGDPEEHGWECLEQEHTCTVCGVTETHHWKEVEGSNTATCTEGGVRTVYCTVCEMTQEEESPAKGHALNSRYNHTATEHYQKCSVCQEIIEESVGQHQYEYHAGDDDWYCIVCDAGHDWDYCGNTGLTMQEATCQEITYYCAVCGLELVQHGTFPEYHAYEDGVCQYCGAIDPEPPSEEPETPEVPETPEQPEEPEEPEKPQEPEQPEEPTEPEIPENPTEWMVAIIPKHMKWRIPYEPKNHRGATTDGTGRCR